MGYCEQSPPWFYGVICIIKGLKSRKTAKIHDFPIFPIYTPIKWAFYKNIVDYPCSTTFQRLNQGFSESLDSYASN